MKKYITILFLTVIGSMCFQQPCHAGFFSDRKIEIINNYQQIKDKKAIKKVMEQQTKYAVKYDYSKLYNLYSDDFINDDGFTKEVYFKLIKETWASYPDITYTTEIKDIKVNGEKASVDVYETSLATSSEKIEGINIFGELHSYSNGTYFLKKIDNKWKICGEKVQNEKSFLKYGDTRFVKMDLNSPATATPGEYYTASLTIDTPKDAFVIASISRDKITYPQNKADEVFRNMPEDNLLERMFLANKDGKNEYNVATIGMTKSEAINNERIQIYMAGIAFIMTRVNILKEAENENK